MMPGLRGRLLAAVVLAVALALGVIVISFNLILTSRLDADANDLLRSRTTAGLDSLQLVDGALRSQEAPDAGAVDEPIWVFSGTRTLETPRAGPRLDRAARLLSMAPGTRADSVSTRLQAVPVTIAGRRVGTVVAGVSLTPYERSKRIALIGSLVMAIVVLIAVGLAARWLLRAGLRPVDRMSAEAAEWSERDLDRRFGLGPPRDEFTRLAATLDGLLDRIAAGVRRERRFAAELSHELRTAMAKIRARAQLALAPGAGPEESRAALSGAVAETDRLTRVLDSILGASRAELGQARRSGDPHQAAIAAIDACTSERDADRIAIDLNGPEGVRLGVDPELIERILSPVLENACRHARSRVGVSFDADRSEVAFLVTDDGEGVRPGELERIFEPGVMGDGSGNGSGSAGLGLALSRRLARASGGEVEALRSDSGGCFSIRLPRS